jgi:hypothetical protein
MARLFAFVALVVMTCACSQEGFQSPTAPTSTLVETRLQQASAKTTSISSMVVEGRTLVWTAAQGFNPRELTPDNEMASVLGNMPKATLLSEAYIETAPNGRAILVQGEILKASWAAPEVIRCEGSVDGAFLEIVKTQDFLNASFVAQSSEWRLAQLDNLRREEFRLIDPNMSTPEDRILYKKLCS